MQRQIILTIIIVFTFLIAEVYAAATSNIEGYVIDAQTNDPLPGANIILIGTSFGAATDINGKYIIKNIPVGTYRIRASYVGYENKESDVSVVENITTEHNFELLPVGVEGETVVITAQASGQLGAINKQLSSDQIINAVSAARIQELPDANAAESIGRLPGISVLRSGGEGNEVVIRGLAPKYNQITINGIQLSSSNPNNRSTDLSMISPYMLEGIEVSKTVTPDMDANVIGGTVNFELREAKVTEPGVPQIGLLLQGGYNNLSNAYNKFNNYKYAASIEDRFFDDRFGVLALIDIERRNLTSNELGASYNHQGSSITEYITTALNLNDIPRDRKRINGTIVLDYKLNQGKISIMNFLSAGTTDIQNRIETFDIQNNIHRYSLAHSKSDLSVITNAINLKYQLPVFYLDAKLSHSYSETENPNDWTIGFQQASAGLSQFLNVSNINPQEIPKAVNASADATYLGSLVTNSSFSRSRAITGSIDLETNFSFSDLINAKIKFGGKYRYQTRSYDYDQSGGQGLGLASARYVDSLIATRFQSTKQYANTTSIPISPFVDPNFDYGKFLDGNYSMHLPLNFAMLSEIANFIKRNVDLIAKNNGSIAYFHDKFNSTTFNYSGNEDQSAFYVMATLNVGPQITLIPGVRYQELKTSYKAPRGIQNTASMLGGPYFHYDTTLAQKNGYWLPGISLKYKPLDWFDVRLSYSNTLAYPDYNSIVPRIDVSTIGTISWNNYQLVPSKSRNYDVYFSFYNNNIGLFTAGGYLKHIDNLIYPWNFYVTGADAAKYYPPGLLSSTPTGTYNVLTFVNDPFRAEVWGLEFDWQTHFWYLPYPFDGLVFNINYTHVSSTAKYPYTDARRVGRVIEYVDTSFTDRLLYQPDNIINLSIGYDYKDFSIRVSMLYQDDIFTGPNFWPQLRSSTAAYRRWDIAVKQNLPWFGIQVFGNINNINQADDISIIQKAGVPQSQQDYGMTANIGIKWKL